MHSCHRIFSLPLFASRLARFVHLSLPQARESTVAPTPRYLHRVALAADGWYYLFGGHLQESMAGDVWRFRAQEPKNPGYNRDARLKVVWEQVDGVALAPAGAGAANDDEEESESSSDDSGFGNTDSERGTGVDENENRAAGDAADHPATIEPQPNAPQGPGQIPAMAAGAGAAGNQGAPGGVPVIPPHLDDDLQQQRPRPRPRCAVSWTCAPGSNKIFLFGGLGSDGNFLCDLWCFHAGGRGECRWEELQSVRDDGKAAEEEPGDSPLEPPEARWGHTMVEHGGLMYMFGGSSPGHAFGKLWRLDTSAWPCVWSLVRPSGDLPPKRGGHAATVVGDTLYIFGGHIVRVSLSRQFSYGAGSLVACYKHGSDKSLKARRPGPNMAVSRVLRVLDVIFRSVRWHLGLPRCIFTVCLVAVLH